MKWYSRISLGLSLAVASAFLVAYWRSLDSHSYPNMNAPGLFAYLLVFPACALLLHSTALAFVLQQRKLGSAREERCNGRSTWCCGWRRFVMSLPASSPMYFPSTRRATSHEGRFIIFLGAMSVLSISMGGRSAGPASRPCSVASFSQE